MSLKKFKSHKSKDNIEITAENFEYDRKQNIIIAEKNVFLNDKIKKEIYSDYISYDLNKDIIVSKKIQKL